jgi:integrase/recombinase XerD
VLLDEFAADLKVSLSKTAYYSYPRSARSFLWYMSQRGVTDMRALPPGALRDYQVWLLTPSPGVRVPKPRTVRQCISGIRSYLDYLRGSGVPVPAQAKSRLPRVDYKLPHVLSRPELAVFVEQSLAQKEPYATALLILPFCGLRISELVHLRLQDVLWLDLDDGDRRYVLHVAKGKGGRERLSPMFNGPRGLISRAFDVYMTTTRPKFEAEKQVARSERWLFPGFCSTLASEHHPISRQKCESLMNEHFREPMGVPTMHPHMCRSHYATALLSLGRNMRLAATEVTRYLGHGKSLDTLAEHYAGVHLEDVEDWMGEIARPTQDQYRYFERRR